MPGGLPFPQKHCSPSNKGSGHRDTLGNKKDQTPSRAPHDPAPRGPLYKAGPLFPPAKPTEHLGGAQGGDARDSTGVPAPNPLHMQDTVRHPGALGAQAHAQGCVAACVILMLWLSIGRTLQGWLRAPRSHSPACRGAWPGVWLGPGGKGECCPRLTWQPSCEDPRPPTGQLLGPRVPRGRAGAYGQFPGFPGREGIPELMLRAWLW